MACLNQTTKEFDISPAYFDYKDFEGAKRTAKKCAVQDFIHNRLGFTPVASVQQIVEKCFAAVCYHLPYLQKNLHVNSPLQSCALFRKIPTEVSELATVRYTYNKTSDTPKLTGIPPHSLHLAELHELKLEIKCLKTDMMDDFKAEMDKRGFNSTKCSTQKIMELISDVTAKQTKAIITRILEKTNLAERSIANAMARLEAEYQVHQMEVEEELEVEMPNDPTYGKVQDIQRTRLVASAVAASKTQYIVGLVKVTTSKGVVCKLSTLPVAFKFPSLTIPQLIDNWFIGNQEANIVPYCTLVFKDVNHITGGKVQLWKMLRVMKVV